jgi:trans-aconitate 2-methyltransferase
MIARLKSEPVATDWDAKAYQQFSRLRQRPVSELLDRVDLKQPKRIYDLGCGTGIATQLSDTASPQPHSRDSTPSSSHTDSARWNVAFAAGMPQ